MTGEFAIAVHALVYLNHVQETVSSDALAANVCTNPARIRKVLAKLHKAALVDTKEGAVGGYRFRLDPGKVTLLNVLNAVGQTMVCPAWRSGDPHLDCLIASGMANVMDRIYLEMNDCCNERLATITIRDIERELFQT